MKTVSIRTRPTLSFIDLHTSTKVRFIAALTVLFFIVSPINITFAAEPIPGDTSQDVGVPVDEAVIKAEEGITVTDTTMPSGPLTSATPERSSEEYKADAKDLLKNHMPATTKNCRFKNKADNVEKQIVRYEDLIRKVTGDSSYEFERSDRSEYSLAAAPNLLQIRRNLQLATKRTATDDFVRTAVLDAEDADGYGKTAKYNYDNALLDLNTIKDLHKSVVAEQKSKRQEAQAASREITKTIRQVEALERQETSLKKRFETELKRIEAVDPAYKLDLSVYKPVLESSQPIYDLGATKIRMTTSIKDLQDFINQAEQDASESVLQQMLADAEGRRNAAQANLATAKAGLKDVQAERTSAVEEAKQLRGELQGLKAQANSIGEEVKDTLDQISRLESQIRQVDANYAAEADIITDDTAERAETAAGQALAGLNPVILGAIRLSVPEIRDEINSASEAKNDMEEELRIAQMELESVRDLLKEAQQYYDTMPKLVQNCAVNSLVFHPETGEVVGGILNLTLANGVSQEVALKMVYPEPEFAQPDVSESSVGQLIVTSPPHANFRGAFEGMLYNNRRFDIRIGAPPSDGMGSSVGIVETTTMPPAGAVPPAGAEEDDTQALSALKEGESPDVTTEEVHPEGDYADMDGMDGGEYMDIPDTELEPEPKTYGWAPEKNAFYMGNSIEGGLTYDGRINDSVMRYIDSISDDRVAGLLDDDYGFNPPVVSAWSEQEQCRYEYRLEVNQATGGYYPKEIIRRPVEGKAEYSSVTTNKQGQWKSTGVWRPLL